MKHDEEYELKTIVTEQQFNELTSFYPDLHFVEQKNIYYVTNDISHYAFRVRIRNNEKLFTLKQKADGKIIEHEKPFTGELEDDPEIMETLSSFHLNPPYQVFGTLITERAMFINDYAELCFDINHYNGITDYELEYEVKKEHDSLTAFKQILSKANIEYIPSPCSKYKRCLNTLKSK